MNNRLLSWMAFALSIPAAIAGADYTPNTLGIGERAPDFTLPGVDGREYSLGDFADRDVLVLVFTCNHCPTAQAYEERIQALATDYKDRGVALVAISPNDNDALRLDELGFSDLDDSFEAMKIRAKDCGFAFPYLYDGDTQEMSMAYGPVSTPHVFVFDKDRILRYTGRIDDSERIARVKVQDTRNAIDALLAGEPVPVQTTKTYGCSVKWSDKVSTVKEADARWAGREVFLQLVGTDGLPSIIENKDTGNFRLINVWATWCGPCVAEFPELVKIQRMYENRNFELITISTDSVEQHEKVLAFLKKHQAAVMSNFRFAEEDPYALIEAVDPAWQGALPYTMIVAPGGEVIYRHMGAINPIEVRKVLADKLGRVYE